MKKAVFFDMDGTMFDTEKLYCESYIQAFGEVGIPFTKVDYLKYTGRTEKVNLKRTHTLMNSVEKGNAVFQRAKDLRVTMFEQMLEKKPGLDMLLDYLQAKGIKSYIASSTNMDIIIKLLDQTKTAHYFSGIVSGQFVERSKPHPDIYLEVLEKSGFEKNECFIIEDSLAGVESGFRSGIETIMIPDLIEPPEETRQQAAYIFRTLDDVITIL